MSESPSKKNKMASSLDQLKEMTVVVADTGDFESKCHHLFVARHTWPSNPTRAGVCGCDVGVFS